MYSGNATFSAITATRKKLKPILLNVLQVLISSVKSNAVVLIETVEHLMKGLCIIFQIKITNHFNGSF